MSIRTMFLFPRLFFISKGLALSFAQNSDADITPERLHCSLNGAVKKSITE